MTLDANLLTILGLVLDLVGGLILGLGALGSAQFLDELEAEAKVGDQMARLWYVSTVNRVFVYILVWALGFAGTRLLLSRIGVVGALLVAPLIYFAWRLAARFTGWLKGLVAKFAPNRVISQPLTGLGCLMYVALGVPWLLLYVASALGAVLIEFGLTIPLTWLSEAVIGPVVLSILRLTAKMQLREQDRPFKSYAFIGMVLIAGGFFYQLLGALMQMVASKP